MACLPKYSSLISGIEMLHNIHIHVSLIQLVQTTSSLSSVISTTEQGVKGALVKCLGDIYFNMKDNEPFHFIGEFPLHKEDVHLLISGVHFNFNDASTEQFRRNNFKPGNSWLQGIHIDMTRELLHQSMGSVQNDTGLSKHILLSPTLFTYSLTDNFDSVAYLRNALINSNLYEKEQLLAENFLIPANITNTHWILISLSIPKLSYWVINPYHPQQPTPEDIASAQKIIALFSKTFGLSKFVLQPCPLVQSLPAHHRDDSINCGFDVLIFIEISILGFTAALPFSIEVF